jgi:N-acetylmuramoyl-L-alanine amidase
MPKELILKDIYEANLKGKASKETRFYRVKRTASDNQLIPPEIKKKSRSKIYFFSSLLFFCGLVYILKGVEFGWIIHSHKPEPFQVEKNNQLNFSTQTPLFSVAALGVADQEIFADVKTSLFHNGHSIDRFDYLAWSKNEKVSMARLLGLGVKTIVIDPGHGGKDPGAIGPSGLQEKEVTMALARKLKRNLERHRQYRVILTHDNDTTMSLKRRVSFANENDADLFISLHINSLPVEHATVVETYFFGPQSDDNAKSSAERENQGSDYSMGEFRKMIAQIWDSFKQQESKNLAMSIQKTLFRNLKKQKNSLKNWGIKTAPFVILLGVDMPSVLAEVTTLSNVDEEQKLRTESYREKIASYLELGITSYLDQVNFNYQNHINGEIKNGSKTAGNS